MTNVVLNGNAYSDDGSAARDMQGGGHRQWLLPMLGDAAVVAGSISASVGAASASAAAALASQGAAATSATNAQNSYNAANAIGSGWTAVTQAVADGSRVVLQVTNWVGGKGTKPGVGYVGPTGLVATAALATNIRGAVAYADLTGKPTLGTAAPLNVPVAAGTAATAAQVVRGDDPRLATAATRGTQLYTTSQSIAKSTFGTASYVLVELWAGGASGGATVSTTSGPAERAGGEGGEYFQVILTVADLSTTTSLVIGSGGAPVTAMATGATTSLIGNAGGDTTFGPLAVALGGTTDPGLGQAGASKPLIGRNGGTGKPNSANSSSSMMGGGGGGGSALVSQDPGTSVFGGNGGAGKLVTTTAQTADSGAIPSGGGGGIRCNLMTGTATSGAGARGQCRLTWW